MSSIKTAQAANETEIVRACRLLTQNDPEAVVEIRIPKAGAAGTVSGYFDASSFCSIPAAIKKYSAFNIYITIQWLNTALLARRANRMVERCELTTSDKDVHGYRWIPVDVDPVRPAGISASDDELAAAEEIAYKIRDARHDFGLDEPVLAMSGNGYHLLFPINLANTPQNAELLRDVLVVLAERFDNESAKVDRTVYNPARIWKLYGTVSRKGDSISDRPHRLSKIIHIPQGMEGG